MLGIVWARIVRKLKFNGVVLILLRVALFILVHVRWLSPWQAVELVAEVLIFLISPIDLLKLLLIHRCLKRELFVNPSGRIWRQLGWREFYRRIFHYLELTRVSSHVALHAVGLFLDVLLQSFELIVFFVLVSFWDLTHLVLGRVILNFNKRLDKLLLGFFLHICAPDRWS